MKREKFKVNYMVKLELVFGDPDGFKEFLKWYTHRAGSSWNDEQIKYKGKGRFEIEATASELYNLGYDWALYQFPPTKK